MIANGDLTEKQRNELLVSMTDTVGKLVISNNFKQNAALTLCGYQAPDNLQMHYRLQKELERDAGLDPVVEFLPNNDEITARAAIKQGYTNPELAVLMAYCKILIKRRLQDSELTEDPAVDHVLIHYFPQTLHDERYSSYVKAHRLKRAIIATQISNNIVNEMGINFMQRLAEETSMDYPQISRAYIIARAVFELPQLLVAIRELANVVTTDVQINMWLDLNRLMRRTTRWFVRNLPANMSIDAAIKLYKPKIKELHDDLESITSGAWHEQMQSEQTRLIQLGVPSNFAKTASSFNTMFTSLDIVQAAIQYDFDLKQVGKVYFCVGTELKLGWFGELIKRQPVHNYWEALARSVFRDDVDKQQRQLAISIMQSSPIQKSPEKLPSVDMQVKAWLDQHQELLQRWDFFITELKVSEPEYTMFAVALREFLDLFTAPAG